MGAPELLALSLGLSVAVAALAWAGGRLIERSSADPRLRDRMWGVALLLPALPPLAIGLLLLTPPPVREVMLTAAAPGAPAPDAALDLSAAALAVLACAGLLTLARLGALLFRTRRLHGVIRGAGTIDASIAGTVEAVAGRLAVQAPRVVVSDATPEALLAGLGRPRLILPAHLATAADPAVVDAIITHELAHLKRGDHRTLWLEELLLALLAVNPLTLLLRARRAAAREEACDALALAGAGPETRRAYAQSLIEALRSRAGPYDAGVLPVLTFTGAGRTTAMHRLKAVLTPAAPAGRRARLGVAVAGLSLLAAAGAASVAVAAQREAETRLIAPPAADADAAYEAPNVAQEPQVIDRIPETARIGEVFQMRTPAGRIVEAWRGRPSDNPAYAAPSGPVLQARLGEPPVPAGLLVRGTISQGPAAPFAGDVGGTLINGSAGASGQGQTGAFNGAATGKTERMHEVEIVAHGTQNRQAPPPPPIAGQRSGRMREVEITARGTQNRGAPPPPPTVRRGQARPAPEVEVRAYGSGNRQAPPPPPALRPDRVRPAQPGAPTAEVEVRARNRQAPPAPPTVLRVRPARPGAPTSSPPIG
jgi:beta-lactamase regulating signal transducer with metallopeptidase domain